MSIKPRLFYNTKPCCEKLLNMINENGLEDEFIYHNVEDPAVIAKLPPSYTRVPILIVKGINGPLMGREVFIWLESQQYFNMKSNNIEKASPNLEFKAPTLLAKPIDTNSAAIGILNGQVVDRDDKKMNQSYLYTEDWNKCKITNDLSKRYIDTKISEEAQQRKLAQIIEERNATLESIMDKNKKF